MRSLIAVTLAAAIAIPAAASETLRALSSEALSPLTRAADDAQPGFNVELVEAIAERAGFDLEVERTDWRGAQGRIARGEDALLFGLTRTAAREDYFEWILPLVTVERVFVTTGAPIDGLTEARTVPRIGARFLYADTLTDAGIDAATGGEIDALMQALADGELDAVYTQSARALYTWTQDLGHPAEALTIGQGMERGDIWLAAGQGFDPDTAERLRAAAEAVRADGTYARLHAAYFGDLPILEPATGR